MSHSPTREPGRGCRALQGFAVDAPQGSRAGRCHASPRCKNVVPGAKHDQTGAAFAVIFMDDKLSLSSGSVCLKGFLGEGRPIGKRCLDETVQSSGESPRGDHYDRPAGRHRRSVVRRCASRGAGKIRLETTGLRTKNEEACGTACSSSSSLIPQASRPSTASGSICTSRHSRRVEASSPAKNIRRPRPNTGPSSSVQSVCRPRRTCGSLCSCVPG